MHCLTNLGTLPCRFAFPLFGSLRYIHHKHSSFFLSSLPPDQAWASLYYPSLQTAQLELLSKCCEDATLPTSELCHELFGLTSVNSKPVGHKDRLRLDAMPRLVYRGPHTPEPCLANIWVPQLGT